METKEGNNSLNVCVCSMNVQHNTIMRALMELEDCCGHELLDKFDNFFNMVTIHFQEEENILLQSGCPDYMAHKQIHELFIDNLRLVRKSAVISGRLEDVHLEYLRTWHISHTQGFDSKYSLYLDNILNENSIKQ